MDDAANFEAFKIKGERFFSRKNFPLAKQAFDSALKIREEAGLREKAGVCVQEILRQKRQDAIKKGRRLEKKKKFAEALLCFEEAAKGEEEAWLTDKIADLRNKATFSSVTDTVRQVEQSDDLETRLAAYDQALALHPDSLTVDRKAECLLRLQRDAEVLSLYDGHAPAGQRGHYLKGLALARQGRYGEMVVEWESVETDHEPFWQQWLGLVPFVYQELRDVPPGSIHVSAWRIQHRLRQRQPDAPSTPYERWFKQQTMMVCWNETRYEELLDLLLPFPETLTLSSLGWYGRLFFKRAEHDANHCLAAIPLWLTAVHQDPLLANLAVHQVMATPVDLPSLRDRLVQAMARVIDDHGRKGTLPDGVMASWEWEKQAVESLAHWPVGENRPELFPCTPGFAARFGLSSAVLEFLQENRHPQDEGDERFQELRASFSPAGPSLVLLAQGEEDKALALLPPPSGRDGLGDYCRHRVNWALALKKMQSGEKHARKRFMAALPLVQAYPAHGDALIAMAYEDLHAHVITELAEVMEVLSPHITSRRFREAAAHAMGNKAQQLLQNRKRNVQTIEGLLDRADAIHANNEMVKSAREDLHRATTFDQVSKALQKHSMDRAAHIALASDDPEIKRMFFKAMGSWTQQVLGLEPEARLAELRIFHRSCLILDPGHPVTLDIGDMLNRLELS